MAKGFVGALSNERTLGKAYNIVGDEIMNWRTFHARMARAIGFEANIVGMTTEQLLAGAPPGKADWLKDNFQYHAAYTSAELKADVPEYTDLLEWEEGVRRTVRWMDDASVHAPADSCSWVDALATEALAFERRLTDARIDS